MSFRELDSRALLAPGDTSVAPAIVLLDPPAVSRVGTFGSLLMRGVAVALSETLLPLESLGLMFFVCVHSDFY